MATKYICIITAGLLSMATALSTAAAYPERPVKVVVPFSAGGTIDKLVRLVGESLTQDLSQPFILDFRPGAGGNIGTSYAVQAKPDGYTLIVNSVGPIAVNPSLTKLNYDPLTDLVPIVQIATVPNVLLVPPSLPINNIDDFLKYAKSQKTLSYGSTGIGTSSHLSSYMLMRDLGVGSAVHIPYKGQDGLNDLIAGRLNFMFVTAPSAMAFINSGKLRAIAVSSKRRLSALPDLPTVAESGFEDFDAGSWYGFFAPKGTPQEVINAINKSVNDSLPILSKRMISDGAAPIGGTPEEFERFIRTEYEKWKTIVEQTAVTAQ